MFTLNCKGRLFTIDSPVIMGIINITPDSFYPGSRAATTDAAIAKAKNMIDDGAAMLDIGGQSTRPGSPPVTAETEADRVLPVIKMIVDHYPEILVSVDTFYAAVAKEAVNAGAHIVNDISGGSMDPLMIPTVARLHVPFICMHMKGTPETMQKLANYTDITREVVDYFIEKTALCTAEGIDDIILDPGFGFAKTHFHNLELLKNLHTLKVLGKPILAGLSRKSTIYKLLDVGPADALNGTTVLNTIALLNGANILRVHDVKQAVEVVKLVTACYPPR